MVFSVNYHSKHKTIAYEIRCPFNQLGTLFDFIKQYPNKRYNIIIPDDLTATGLKKTMEQVEFIKEVARDYTIQCGNILQLKDLISNGYNAFLRFPVTDWETFYELRDLGVSDIYIDGPLGFQVQNITNGKKDIKIRVSPTVSPNNAIAGRKSPSSFFIRPEDLVFYESAFDIVDFKVQDQDQEDALFSIYTRGTFNYNTDELIKGLTYKVNNLMFKPDFVNNRLNCGQKCKIPGYSCHICETYFHVIEQLTDLHEIKADY